MIFKRIPRFTKIPIFVDRYCCQNENQKTFFSNRVYDKDTRPFLRNWVIPQKTKFFFPFAFYNSVKKNLKFLN